MDDYNEISNYNDLKYNICEIFNIFNSLNLMGSKYREKKFCNKN
jgi:hypothetical protein